MINKYFKTTLVLLWKSKIKLRLQIILTLDNDDCVLQFLWFGFIYIVYRNKIERIDNFISVNHEPKINCYTRKFIRGNYLCYLSIRVNNSFRSMKFNH